MRIEGVWIARRPPPPDKRIKRERRFIIAAAMAVFFALLALSSVILAVKFAHVGGQPEKPQSCEWTRTAPSNPRRISPISSADRRILAGTVGHLMVDSDEGREYTALQLREARHESFRDEWHVVELVFDCASLTIDLLEDKTSEDNQYNATSFWLNSKLKAEPIKLRLDHPIAFNRGQYFSCFKGVKLHSAVDKDLVVVDLQLLLLELDGNPRRVAKGIFSKSPVNC